MIKFIRPKKPFKNMEDARQQMWKGFYKRGTKGAFPCFECDGRGQVTWDDTLGSYRSAMCTDCSAGQGSGQCTKEDFKEWYDKQMAEYAQEYQDWRRGRTLLAIAQNHFSDEDLSFFVLYTKRQLYGQVQ